MDTALDMSLDDIIKSKKTAGRRRGRAGLCQGGGSSRGSFRVERVRDIGRGAGRKGPLGVNARPSSSAVAKSSRRTKKFLWQCDLFEASLAATGLSRIESGMKLCISNLDHGISNNYIRDLFAEIGELKRYAIHFDKNGRPSGTAEVVYAKRSDAFVGHKRYNNVQLDGRPMTIEIICPNSEAPVSARVNIVRGVNWKSSRRVVLMQNTGRTISSAPTNHIVRKRGGLRNGQARQTQSQGRDQGQRCRGRGHGKMQPVEKSAEELDKELDNYHAEAMQT